MPREAAEPRGTSLRWKILGAIALLVVFTGLVTFVASYASAVVQMDREVDKKGIALLKSLAAVDSGVWITAALTPMDPGERKERWRRYLHEALDRGFGSKGWMRLLNEGGYDRARNLLANAEALIERDAGRFGYLTPETTAVCAQNAYEAVAIFLAAQQRRTSADPAPLTDEVKRRMDPWLRLLAHPAGALRLFREHASEGIGGDIIGISVTFEASATGSYAGWSGDIRSPGMAEGLDFTDYREVHDGEDKIDVGDAVMDGVPLRSFVMSREVPEGKLLFTAHIRTADIHRARRRLMLYMFLAILGAIGVGVVAAFYVAGRITGPIERLTEDVRIVQSGNLKHETVPETNDEIGVLAEAFNEMTRAVAESIQLQIQQKAIEHELGLAHQIQANMLPKRLPKFDPYEIHAFYRPAKEVGGDYYDLFEIDEDHLGIVVADVSGKGVPGSMVVSMVRTLLRMEADRTRNLSPSDTMKHVNRLLAQDIKKGMFVTALYGILDRKRNALSVVSAGHNPLVVWKAREKKILLVNPNGIALGFDRGTTFDRTIKEEVVPMEPGDVFVGYTDGVVEAMGPKCEEYGDERFHALVRAHAHQPMNLLVQTIVKDLERHQGEAEQHDDITIVAVRRN